MCLSIRVERVFSKTGQCLCSSWWRFPTEKRVQNQSNDSHLVIFDWNSKNWLDGGTVRSLVISCCAKASEQNLHTKPELLPSRNEAGLRRGGVERERGGWVTIFNSWQSREVTQVKVQKAEWLIYFKLLMKWHRISAVADLTFYNCSECFLQTLRHMQALSCIYDYLWADIVKSPN